VVLSLDRLLLSLLRDLDCGCGLFIDTVSSACSGHHVLVFFSGQDSLVVAIWRCITLQKVRGVPYFLAACDHFSVVVSERC